MEMLGYKEGKEASSKVHMGGQIMTNLILQTVDKLSPLLTLLFLAE